MKISIFALLLCFILPFGVQNADLKCPIPAQEIQKITNLNQYDKFKQHLAKLESSDNYHITSPSGSFLGKYQFGKLALKDIEFNYSTQEFLDSKALQEQALYKYLQVNRRYLADEIAKFTGKTINGIQITESGMLAAAHLAGARSVKRFLYSHGEAIFRDGNGTPLTRYLKEFSDLRFSFSDQVYYHILERYA